jgi:hypothetical protein
MQQLRRPQQDQTLPPMTGREGLRAREKMIRSMFTPETPAALQQQIFTMMLKAPEATAAGALAAIVDSTIQKDDVVRMPALAIYSGRRGSPTSGT